MSSPDTAPQPAAEQAPATGPTLRAAKAPVGLGGLPLVAQLIALLLVVLGGVLIQEALVRTGVLTQPSWTRSTLESIGTVAQDSPLVLVVAVVLGVLGLVLLPAPFLRRPRTSVTLNADTGVFLRRRDVSRLVAHAVDGTDTVTDVGVRGSRRSLKVRATSVAPADQGAAVREELQTRLDQTLSALRRPPRTSVSVRHLEEDR